MYYLLLLEQVLLVIFEAFAKNTLTYFPCVCFPIGNISLSKPVRTFCFPSASLFGFPRVSTFFLSRLGPLV